MAKQPISKLTTDLNNIQALPDVVKGQATTLKATFDESGNEIKVYVNTVLTEELNGSDGANKIGLTNSNLSADNVGDGVEEVRQIAIQAQSGTILPNSITDEKLSADVKVGSLGSLTTTNKTSVTASINELDAEVGANTANISTTALTLDILRTAKITTGSSVALTVDTDGTFDLTRNGNILHIIPNVTSTGGMTINVDGQGAIGIRKANDAGTLVALEAGDIKINVPTQLVRDTVNNFFVYAPRGGSNIKSIQRGIITWNNTNTAQTITISSVETSKSVILISHTGDFARAQYTVGVFNSSTVVNFTRNQGLNIGTGDERTVHWTVIEFNNVKSKQTGSLSTVDGNTELDVIVSSFSTSKCMLFSFYTTSDGTVGGSNRPIRSRVKNATNISFMANVLHTINWQLIEFN
jgi:hypothetical protein